MRVEINGTWRHLHLFIAANTKLIRLIVHRGKDSRRKNCANGGPFTQNYLVRQDKQLNSAQCTIVQSKKQDERMDHTRSVNLLDRKKSKKFSSSDQMEKIVRSSTQVSMNSSLT